MQDPDRTNPAEAFFIQALDLPDSERNAFLADVCRDKPELLAQVQELLAAHEQTGSFVVDRHAEWTEGSSSPMIIGSQIGPYTLREKIGEGGMGEVYVAEQEKPIARKVALKVIKPGMDSKAVLARFEAEQQALAMMNHRNIAKVLDAGLSPSGSPYFVMELVAGMPITEYCDEKKLTIQDRLELFIQVCRAIQHAHQKGIIHRDIKPSNVLVTEEDGQAVPKVIDFGVAKALSQKLTDRTLYTNFQSFLGTPLYASPEQASLSNVDVDTRSDVYSLGILLYELVTGSTPYNKEELQKAAYEEMCRIIREQEAVRPSAKLTTLGPSASTISERRRSDPNRLIQSVRGDLDWIVMKALEKDRGRRYEGANGLASDIERMLKHEAIEARPPSLAYKVIRFARRNRVAASIATLALLATIAGIGVIRARIQSLQRAAKIAAVEEKYRDLLVSEIQDLILRDKFDLARQRLTDSNVLNLSRTTQEIFEAQIYLFDGKPEQAIEILTPISQNKKVKELFVDAMLCLAYLNAGREEEHLALLSKVSVARRSGFLDHLLVGLAERAFAPKLALNDLLQAQEFDSTSHMAMIGVCQAKVETAENERDPAVAKRLIEESLRGFQSIASYLPENETVQIGMAQAAQDAYYLSQEMRSDDVAEKRSEARNRFLGLKLTSSAAFRARANFFLPSEEYDQLKADYSLSENLGLTHPAQRKCVAIAEYRQGNLDEALLAIDKLERTSEAEKLAYKMFVLLDNVDSRDDFAAELEEQQAGSPELGIMGFWMWPVYYILEDREHLAQSLAALNVHADSIGKTSWSTQVDFILDENINEKQLLDSADDRFSLSYAHFAIAFKALREDDRKKAKFHFGCCAGLKMRSLAVKWSRAFLSRIDDPNWLPWVSPIRNIAGSEDE